MAVVFPAALMVSIPVASFVMAVHSMVVASTVAGSPPFRGFIQALIRRSGQECMVDSGRALALVSIPALAMVLERFTAHLL